jgi:hypothetical protein
MVQRFTILSLLCAFVAIAASDRFPAVGKPFRVSDLTLGSRGAAILFHSSKAQLMELNQHRAAFGKLGVQVAARAADQTGWIVLDSKGIVLAKYFEDDPNQCLTSAALLVHQFGWAPPEPPREVEGKQLTASIDASNATVAPGERVALTMDIDLQPGMHVYAPGVEGYIPIDWKMEDSAAVEQHAPAFPRSEKLYLKAIDETVPAFRNHFRVTRDITIAPADKLQTAIDGSNQFSVDGSLRYQACDDRVCYIPQQLKLHWTFQYGPLPNSRP